MKPVINPFYSHELMPLESWKKNKLISKNWNVACMDSAENAPPVATRIPIYHQWKVVGSVMGNEYHTPRIRKKHYFRKFAGWGISEAVLNGLIWHNVEYIIIDLDNGRHLESTYGQWIKAPLYIDKQTGDRQRILEESQMV